MVCIIDNDREMRETLARLVQSSGLTAETYESTEAFLAGANRSAIDCLLLDAELFCTSGSDLMETLGPGPPRFPLFVLGAILKARDAERASTLGTICIEKPFNAPALARRIRAAVGLQ